MTENSKSFDPPNFTIIRRRGMPQFAYLPDGTRVERSVNSNGFEEIFVKELGGFLRCASYDDHFLYHIPDHLASKYMWARGAALRCTCGSYAVWAGLSAYELDASPQGKLLVCYLHSTTGHHATGGSKWV